MYNGRRVSAAVMSKKPTRFSYANNGFSQFRSYLCWFKFFLNVKKKKKKKSDLGFKRGHLANLLVMESKKHILIERGH